MKKKIISMLAAVAVITTTIAGCGTKTETGEVGNSAGNKEYVFGMSTDQGGLGDKSFNDAAHAGLQKVKAENDNVKEIFVLESKQEENFEPNLKQLAKNNDLTVAVGYLMRGALDKVASENPDKNFTIIDEVVELPNVKSIKFKAEEGSFLMGVIAGEMTKTNKIGFIGGMEDDLILTFEAGFVAGVKAVNPEAAEELLSRKTVKYAASFGDSGKGYELAKSLYSDGCDVIYHAAGATGLGMFKAASETGNWAIGVDQDQAVTNESFADVILSSMIKKIDVATYEACQSVVDGKFVADTTILGLKEGGVDMAESTSKNTPQEVIDIANNYKKAIVEGKITVPGDLESLKNFTVPEI